MSNAAGRRSWGSLSRDAVVRAALDLARREGLDGLSIRKLAAELGASRMSLYHYVTDKVELLDLVANAIAERDLAIPERAGETWEEGLTELARTMRARMLAYPGLSDLIISRGNYRPAGLGVIERVLSLLEEAGVDAADAPRYYVAFSDLVWGRVNRELRGTVTDASRMDRAEQTLAEVAPDRFPRVRAALPGLREVDDDVLFESGLEIFLNGIRAAAEK